jgi:hypothetical protein
MLVFLKNHNEFIAGQKVDSHINEGYLIRCGVVEKKGDQKKEIEKPVKTKK